MLVNSTTTLSPATLVQNGTLINASFPLTSVSMAADEAMQTLEPSGLSDLQAQPLLTTDVPTMYGANNFPINGLQLDNDTSLPIADSITAQANVQRPIEPRSGLFETVVRLGRGLLSVDQNATTTSSPVKPGARLVTNDQAAANLTICNKELEKLQSKNLNLTKLNANLIKSNQNITKKFEELEGILVREKYKEDEKVAYLKQDLSNQEIKCNNSLKASATKTKECEIKNKACEGLKTQCGQTLTARNEEIAQLQDENNKLKAGDSCTETTFGMIGGIFAAAVVGFTAGATLVHCIKKKSAASAGSDRLERVGLRNYSAERDTGV